MRGRNRFSGEMIPIWLKIKEIELPMEIPKEHLEKCIKEKKVPKKWLKETIMSTDRIVDLISKSEFKLVYFPDCLED